MNGKRLKNRPVNTNNFSLNLYKYPFDAIAKNGLIEKYKMNPENWDETIDKRMEDFWDMLQDQFPPMKGETPEAYWERTKEITFKFLNNPTRQFKV